MTSWILGPAALAAGMMTFAACAQEAPAGARFDTGAVVQKQAKDLPEADKAAAPTTTTYMFGRSAGATTPAVPVTPASTGTGRRGEAQQETVVIAKGQAGASYGAIISRYAASYGVPVALAHAVISIESNYRANARGSAGEIGLMQIKPTTARMLGYSGSAKGLYDPETNIKFGMKYLAMARDLGNGTTCSTILKYNAGHAAKRMNPVSAAYCSKVKRRLGS